MRCNELQIEVQCLQYQSKKNYIAIHLSNANLEEWNFNMYTECNVSFVILNYETLHWDVNSQLMQISKAYSLAFIK